MGHASPEEIKKQTKTYLFVFGALAVLTVVTVSVSGLQVGMVAAVAIALLIASVKGSLVAAFFMHLAHAEKVIYWVLLLAALFFGALMLLPILTHTNSVGVPIVTSSSAVENVVPSHSSGEHDVP